MKCSVKFFLFTLISLALGNLSVAPVFAEESSTSVVSSQTTEQSSLAEMDQTTISEPLVSTSNQQSVEVSESLPTTSEEAATTENSQKLVTIYRLYNYETGEHIYTPDLNEKNVLYQHHHWGDEGVAWYAPASGKPIFRLYHPGHHQHLYTADTNEVSVLTRQHGWKLDNQGRPLFYSGGGVPIYRLYNQKHRGLHHWTTDRNEYNTIPKYGWRQEGIAFYASQVGQPIQTKYAHKLLYNGAYYQVRGKYGYVPIINKKHPINSAYHPGENPTAKASFEALTNQMRALGFGISYSYSGFRSYATQHSLYWNYVNQYGQAAADRFSARPGYSEHQSGLAFDVFGTGGGLLSQPNAVHWLAHNAHRYGFVVRYQAGKEWITGYMAEPWHIRYVGPEAADIYNSGLSIEEYYGVAGGGY